MYYLFTLSLGPQTTQLLDMSSLTAHRFGAHSCHVPADAMRLAKPAHALHSVFRSFFLASTPESSAKKTGSRGYSFTGFLKFHLSVPFPDKVALHITALFVSQSSGAEQKQPATGFTLWIFQRSYLWVAVAWNHADGGHNWGSLS